MKEIGRFLRFRLSSLIIFAIFILFLNSSSVFGISRDYISYLILVVVFLFIIDLIISFFKYKKSIEEINNWIYNPASKEPRIIENTKFADLVGGLINKNKQIEDDYKYSIKNLMDYITIWTHQIKTPMFSLNLLLNDHPVDTQGAKSEVFEIEEYIENLLSYIRLSSDTTDYVFEKVSLDELIKASIKKYSLIFIKKKNKINFTPTAKVITTDQKWFAFMIEQIFSNSNKYTASGEISIYLLDNELVIEDTGIGIRAEDLPRVFEKSYTGYNGRLYKKSSGIGLNLVKQIAGNLSIEVSIQSEVGKGTLVIFNLKNILN